MANKFLNFFKISEPAAQRYDNPSEEQKTYKKLRFQSFLAITLGYGLYYVCRTSLNVMKQPIIDSGFLSASQLGVIGSCLLFTYAIGKFLNGFLGDYCNAKRFMAMGLIISAAANTIMGLLGVEAAGAGAANAFIFILFAIMWGINGWGQSMGAAPCVVSLSRWFPLKIRGTYYGFWCLAHNLGEFLSFIFVGLIVSAAGWQAGFFGSAVAGVIGVVIILLMLHDTPESKGLRPVEVLSGECTDEEYEARKAAAAAKSGSRAAQVARKQWEVIKNPKVWVLALASAFMYISRYALNGWGVLFLQKAKDFSLEMATTIVSVNALLGIFGTALSGWLSDKLFKGDRYIPALLCGVLLSVSFAIFLYGGNSVVLNGVAMALFGTAVGALICFLGGLMAVDIVPREVSGAALGVVGLASYVAAGIQDVVSGRLIDKYATTEIVDGVEKIVEYDFGPVSVFWLTASVISFLLPLLNVYLKKREAKRNA